MVRRSMTGYKRQNKKRVRRRITKLITRSPSTKVYAFKRVGQATQYNTTLGALNGESLNHNVNALQFLTGGNSTSQFTYFSNSHYFTLAGVPGYTEFTNLFEKYMIAGIKLKIISFPTSSDSQSSHVEQNSGTCAIIHSAIDTNDATALGAGYLGVDALRQKPTYKTMNMITSKPFKRYFKPRVANEVYGTGGTRFSTPTKKDWISTANTDVEHYGLKYAMEVFSSDSTVDSYVHFKIEATYYLLCRDPY